MRVPFFDLNRLYQDQKQQIDDAVRRVLGSGRYILGTACEDFESRMKKELVGSGQGAVVSCNSGTDALVLSLLALGAEPGDPVITVSHTAIPTITAIRSLGCIPTFVDIDPQTWLLDCEKLEAAITPRTKAIISVHLYGNMVDVPGIVGILRKINRQDISIIEDVAQAQGASLSGEQAGTLGSYGAFSFYPTKNLGAMGDGGAVFCASAENAAKLRMLRYYGQKDRTMTELSRGINSRLDEAQAAILSVRIASLESSLRKKLEIMDRYRQELSDFPIRFQKITPGCRPAWHLGVVAFESISVRDEVRKHLSDQGIETLIHYPTPTHLQPALSRPSGALPVTEALSKAILSLPLNSGLRAEEQAFIIEKITQFFSSN